MKPVVGLTLKKSSCSLWAGETWSPLLPEKQRQQDPHDPKGSASRDGAAKPWLKAIKIESLLLSSTIFELILGRLFYDSLNGSLLEVMDLRYREAQLLQYNQSNV